MRVVRQAAASEPCTVLAGAGSATEHVHAGVADDVALGLDLRNEPFEEWQRVGEATQLPGLDRTDLRAVARQLLLPLEQCGRAVVTPAQPRPASGWEHAGARVLHAEGSSGHLVHHAGRGQPTIRLEGGDGGCGDRAELPVGGDRGAEVDESLLHLHHRRPGGPDREVDPCQHGSSGKIRRRVRRRRPAAGLGQPGAERNDASGNVAAVDLLCGALGRHGRRDPRRVGRCHELDRRGRGEAAHCQHGGHAER